MLLLMLRLHFCEMAQEDKVVSAPVNVFLFFFTISHLLTHFGIHKLFPHHFGSQIDIFKHCVCLCFIPSKATADTQKIKRAHVRLTK